MRATVTADRGQILVKGVLDFKTVPDIWKDALPLINRRDYLEFNLGYVTSANSAGMALLLEWVKFAKSHRKKIAFIHIPQNLQSLAVLAGLEDIISATQK